MALNLEERFERYRLAYLPSPVLIWNGSQENWELRYGPRGMTSRQV
jgi:hypothetical protein